MITQLKRPLCVAVAAAAVASVAAAFSGPAPEVDFRSVDWFTSQKVVNNNGEEIAKVSDLILNRGSGKIEHVVVKTGTVLGMGGRAIAIPYGSFQWNLENFQLAATPEQLKQFPEFTIESWNSMQDAKEDNALRQKLGHDTSNTDPYAGSFDTAQKMKVEGEVTNVERTRMANYGEQVVVTVKTADGSPRRIALGPSWYVNSSSAAPMRGDRVVIETVALPRDPDHMQVGTEYRNGDRVLRVRDAQGHPQWAMKTVEHGGKSYDMCCTRYMLLSTLPGKKIDCRGSECGKVDDVILERNSGELAFISIDPNENFLGIGDTKRLLPWSVANVAMDGTVHIDASKDMVLASYETPKDLSALNTGPQFDGVYKAFKVPSPKFEAAKRVAAVPDSNKTWGKGGTVIGSIQSGSTKSLEGKVLDTTTVQFGNNIQSARAIRVRVNDADEELVLLGPSTYMENQSPICKDGEVVKVEAVRTTIDNKQYWLAKSVECRDRRVVLIDRSNSPAWAQR